MRHATRTATLILALTIGGLVTGGVVMAQGGSGTDSFTGCLTNGGSLTKVAVGDEPAKPCKGNQLQVTWSQTGPPGAPGADGIVPDASCTGSDKVTGVSGGALVCGPDLDDDTTYGGTDFALSGQSCTEGQFVTGVGPDGTIVCADGTPPPPPPPPPELSGPTIVNNAGLTVRAAGGGFATPITTAMLQATDEISGPADLVFTLESAPAQGPLCVTTGNVCGPPGSFVNLGVGDAFTQADIDDGQLLYDQFFTETPGDDSFSFTVSDEDGNEVSGTFQITLTAPPS